MQYLQDRDLAQRYGIARPSVWRWVKTQPKFPHPIKLSAGCTRWRLDEIEA
jgi:prophage regulatory protein